MSNRLGSETSPYLLQHVDNPVHWWPWSPEALAEARSSDRPILLSIGYSACHWCHVMAHESFEDPAIAALMNADFVNIKVDREERPDIDAIYMESVQAMTGHGGWPLTVFLTPEGRPFYGGTYFPPQARPGMPGFPDLLRAIADAWRQRRDEIEASAGRLQAALEPAPIIRPPVLADLPMLSEPALRSAAAAMLASADKERGGFGSAPKFPSSPALRFLLDHGRAWGDSEAISAVLRSLEAMASGGIHDQLAGGFHRYSVDADWIVPHFEKMLYDNALLADLYLDAWRETGEAQFRMVAERTCDYMLTELRDSQGAFLAAQDADTSEGEGSFYSWTPAEIDALLPEDEARWTKRYFGITPEGNFEHGRSVLTARSEGSETELKAASQASIRRRLLEARAEREAPATDDKVLAAWNGLAIRAVARAGALLGRRDYQVAATEAMQFVLTTMRSDVGIAHSWSKGQLGAPAFLSDLAELGRAALALYELKGDPRWYAEAKAMADALIEGFSAPGGGFWMGGPSSEPLLTPKRPLFDAARPSGNASAADLLSRMHALGAGEAYREAALGCLVAGSESMRRAALSTGGLWSAALALQRGGSCLVLAHGESSEQSRIEELVAVARAEMPQETTLVRVGPEVEEAAKPPIASGKRSKDGRAAAYLCYGQTCEAPIHEPDALAARLRRKG